MFVKAFAEDRTNVGSVYEIEQGEQVIFENKLVVDSATIILSGHVFFANTSPTITTQKNRTNAFDCIQGNCVTNSGFDFSNGSALLYDVNLRFSDDETVYFVSHPKVFIRQASSPVFGITSSFSLLEQGYGSTNTFLVTIDDDDSAAVNIFYVSNTFISSSMTLGDSAISRTILENSSATYLVKLSANPIEDISFVINVEAVSGASIRFSNVGTKTIGISNTFVQYLDFNSSNWESGVSLDIYVVDDTDVIDNFVTVNLVSSIKVATSSIVPILTGHVDTVAGITVTATNFVAGYEPWKAFN